jgi:hypothetical protein
MAAGSMKFYVTSALTFLSLMVVAPLAAEPFGGRWGSGAMMGPGMMGSGMRGSGLCDPRAAGLAEWRLEAIERMVKPTEAQKAPLDALKAASAKAAQIISSACPAELPQSPITRLDLMEKRLTSMLDAMKTVRPAFETFYVALSDDQKARLTTAGPRRWGWRGWRMPWSR